MPRRKAQFDLPGVIPSRQQRSRETTLALLEAGPALLCTRSLAELSIGDLCAHIGATVGAFYSRFESKEAYFNALLALTLQDGQVQLSKMPEPGPAPEAGLAERCHLLVGGVVSWMRSHKGVLRAALQQTDSRPNQWTGFKALAQALSQRATLVLLPAMPGSSAPQKAGERRAREPDLARTIAFGFQVVLGTLVNAILNDPGPLSIDDDEIIGRLGHCLFLMLRSVQEVAPARRKARPRRRTQ